MLCGTGVHALSVRDCQLALPLHTMRPVTVKLLCGLIAASLAGCAVSPRQFAQERSTLPTVDVCRAFESATKARDVDFISATSNELSARGVSSFDCRDMVAKENSRTGGVLLGIAAAALLVAAASAGGGVGGAGTAGSSYTSSTDYSWAWDQYYNQYGQLVWSCRGRQTGQFAELYRCQGSIQSDFTWPSKQVGCCQFR